MAEAKHIEFMGCVDARLLNVGGRLGPGRDSEYAPLVTAHRNVIAQLDKVASASPLGAADKFGVKWGVHPKGGSCKEIDADLKISRDESKSFALRSDLVFTEDQYRQMGLEVRSFMRSLQDNKNWDSLPSDYRKELMGLEIAANK